MRILLVEDDEMIGESVAAGLRLAGHAVDWVRDGRAADGARCRRRCTTWCCSTSGCPASPASRC